METKKRKGKSEEEYIVYIKKRKENGEAIVLLAGFDSSKEFKEIADFICDGIDDEIELQAAIDMAERMGGGRVVPRGILVFSKTILSKSLRNPNVQVTIGDKIEEDVVQRINVKRRK